MPQQLGPVPVPTVHTPGERHRHGQGHHCEEQERSHPDGDQLDEDDLRVVRQARARGVGLQHERSPLGIDRTCIDLEQVSPVLDSAVARLVPVGQLGDRAAGAEQGEHRAGQEEPLADQTLVVGPDDPAGTVPDLDVRDRLVPDPDPHERPHLRLRFGPSGPDGGAQPGGDQTPCETLGGHRRVADGLVLRDPPAHHHTAEGHDQKREQAGHREPPDGPPQDGTRGPDVCGCLSPAQQSVHRAAPASWRWRPPPAESGHPAW